MASFYLVRCELYYVNSLFYGMFVIADTAFKQQRLPAWQPVMTAKTVIPTFFIIGALCVPLGAVLYTTSQSVSVTFAYTTQSDYALFSCSRYA